MHKTQINTFRLAPSTPQCSNNRTVPDGYQSLFGTDVFYKRSTQGKRYLDGWKSCLEEGADMAPVDDRDSYESVRLIVGENAQLSCTP